MVHQSTRCKKLQRVFYCNLSKKVQSGAASEILEQGGGTQCRKERHSAAFLSPRESPRECGGCGKARRWERQGLEIKKVQVCKSVYGNNKFDGSLLRNS